MLTTFANLGFSASLPVGKVLLAQAAAGSGPSPSIQWAIVLFAVAAGLALTLSPSRRTYEVKRPRED